MDLEVNKRVVIGGDFNCILDEKFDKKSGIEREKDRIASKTDCVMDNFDLVDVWRFLNTNVSRFTLKQSNPLIQCRLDYFLISNILLENFVEADIRPGIRTNHSAIVLTLNLYKELNRGPGHWKFNNSYLDDDMFVQDMSNNLHFLLQD